jgi:hypothetical protein
MALKVIGAGFGRTGTHALKIALEMLGFGPCYHMLELMAHPEKVPPWQAAADGEAVDWDALFDGYQATVDWPAAYFWRELAAHYPAAKVLLSVRDPQRWYDSFQSTIYNVLTTPLPNNQPYPPRQIMGRKLMLQKTFGGRFEDRDYAIGIFEQHNREVQQSIPAERLLVYEVTQGWEPLCDLLGCAIPQEPFPRTNSVEVFQARSAAERGADTQATSDRPEKPNS